MRHFWTSYVFIFASALACSCAERQPAPDAQPAARIAGAGTRKPCSPGKITTADCLDDQGLVWSACAWNSCGMDRQCREQYQDRR